jgi:hypothetical protein
MIENPRKLVLPDPYNDHHKVALASFRGLPLDEQTKILQEIGIIGPDGKLAPAYAENGDSADSAPDAPSTR